MKKKIIELLKNAKLRDEIVSTIKEVYSYAGTLYSNPDVVMEQFIKDNPDSNVWYEALWRAEEYGELFKVGIAINKYIFEKLEKPSIVFLGEIESLCYDTFYPGGIGGPDLEDIGYDDIYTLFINRVNHELLSSKTSDCFPFCQLQIEEKDEYAEGLFEGIRKSIEGREELGLFLKEYYQEKINDQESILWQNDDIKVILAEKYPVTITRNHKNHKKCYCMSAIISGEASEAVIKDLQNRLSRLLPSIIISLALLKGKESVVFPKTTSELPIIKEDVFQKNKYSIQPLIQAYLAEPTKKDSLERRITNAIRLLVESDFQFDEAVGLALSVAAIEALLGEKGTEISEKLSRDIAVLLEPELDKRGNAELFVKNLYNDRSRVLHGENLQTKKDIRLNARHIASAVLLGIISRKAFMKGIGNEPETLQELLKDIRESHYRSGLPIGIEEYNVRRYWGK